MLVKNVEKKENNTAIFQVEIDADAFEQAVNKAYKKLKNSIYVAGFRKGKAPRVVIEGMYGSDIFHEEAVQEIAPEAFDFAVGEEKLETVGTPSVADFSVDENKVCTITFTTDLYPAVTLGEYKGLEAPYAEPEVKDVEIDGQLEATRKRNARYVDVERPVQNGDTIVLDFEGFVGGVPFEGGKAENYSLEIGSGSFIPGFEDQLVGMSAGQEGEVNVTFPEQYDPKLAGKDATFKVKVHAVREPQLPELDDEFAKDVSEFDTLDEYKADLKTKTLERKRQNAEMDFKNAVVTEAIDRMEVTVPASMIDEKADEFLMNYSDSMGLPRGRVSRADLIKALGFTEESYAAMMRPVAERQVKADLLFDAVAKAEGLEATDEDREEFYKRLAEDYGEDAEKIKGMIDEKLMVQDIVRRKAADILYDSAVKTEPKPEEEKPAEETSEEAPAGEPSAE
ncbi:MAG TPA: trigger factor [Candidatus Scatomorpha merdipullorum]|uniref:Trigger factor n=1 Tax=Candidatus Scatomorpha merdipullorum TaxID=2840927 RepID=A0A9D1FC95_9FIRM|nr:trigger factor [Candidatus Scatomorpha merdipullorum]